MSIPTVKRHIAAARTMGADIVSIKKNGQSVYHLLNWEEIREKTTRWLMLEHEQNLKGPM